MSDGIGDGVGVGGCASSAHSSWVLVGVRVIAISDGVGVGVGAASAQRSWGVCLGERFGVAATEVVVGFVVVVSGIWGGSCLFALRAFKLACLILCNRLIFCC